MLFQGSSYVSVFLKSDGVCGWHDEYSHLIPNFHGERLFQWVEPLASLD